MQEVFEKIKVMLAEQYRKNRYESHNDEWNVGIDQAEQIVNEVAAEYNDGWIPCSECLPDEGRFYFVTIEMWNKAYGTEYCLFEDGKWYLVADGASDENTTWKEEIKSVIAWQPLPQPYEPKEVKS